MDRDNSYLEFSEGHDHCCKYCRGIGLCICSEEQN